MANLYKISIEKPDWDYWIAAIVCADDEYEARTIHPSGDDDDWASRYPSWASDPIFVDVQYVGEAAGEIKVGSVVLASFRAG